MVAVVAAVGAVGVAVGGVVVAVVAGAGAGEPGQWRGAGAALGPWEAPA